MTLSMAMRVLAFASLAAQVFARSVPEASVVHEKREFIGDAWIKRDRVDPDVQLPVRIGLKQNKYALDNAANWLMEVSDPDSEKYGQHWTSDQVIEAFRPSDESVEEVLRWLEQEGAISRDRVTHTDNKAWLALDASTAELETLVKAQYHEHEHVDSGNLMVSCDEYHIPTRLQDHIDYITPGVKGIHVKTEGSLVKRSRRGPDGRWHGPNQRPAPRCPPPGKELEECDVTITPPCLQALYDFQPADPNTPVSSSNSMGIFEEGSYYSQEDLNLYYTNFTRYIPNGTHPIYKSIDGGVGPVNVKQAGGEADLDFELAIPIVFPQTTTLFSTDDRYYASGRSKYIGIFNTFFDALDGSYCNYTAYGETGNSPIDPKYPDPHKGGYHHKLQCGVYKPTNVISISYGDQEVTLPYNYQERQCNEFLKLGLQGTTITVASGDTGVGGFPGDGAGTKNGCLKNGKVFSPTQPNSCPYLTNVGATKVYPGHSVFEPNPESAANDPKGDPYSSAFSSGGGFSNIFKIPSYQQAAVAEYFKNHNPPYPYYYDGNYNQSANGLYNRNGRGIPDVAANGDNIATYIRGNYALSGGTSASSPIFASLINRIVEERIRAGKGPVGFINPVLYKNPSVLNDIVNGSNPGCGTNGFSAVPGWDPVTGLGTPNYPKMLNLFMSLP